MTSFPNPSGNRPGAGKEWRRGTRLALAGGLVLFVVACGAISAIAPRESWNRKWGPMVPHSTFPGDCELCHVPERWDIIKDDFTFDHFAETGRELTGAHAFAACIRCHNDRGPVTAYVERGCSGCHGDPHRGGLGLDCESCHQTDSWQATGMIADHSRTRFPLFGTHAITACESCHERASVGEFRGAPAQCHLCHQDEVAQASPNHIANGWVVNCHQCHTPLDWTAQLFDHAFFPLAGGHAGLDCGQCHANENFNNTPNDCYSCHSVDYLTAPNHVANGFSTDCSTCHPITVWADAN